VDVLLGYQMKDNRLEATVRRLQAARRGKDRSGLSEAEKALKKYPHSFRIVNESAAMYRAFGFESGDAALLRRALELTEQSRLLLGQNTDPELSEQTLYGRMADIYLGLNDADKAIELWKAHNADGLYNHKIGHVLAACERTEEAAPFLSKAMAKIVSDLSNTVIGYMNVFFTRGDFLSAQAILRLGTEFLLGLQEAGRPNFLDKINSALFATLAYAQYRSGQEEAARASLRKAKELAALFDAAPSYDESDIRFISRIEGASVHDDIGATAMDAVDTAVEECEDEAFTALWRAIAEKEETNHG
jgi:tetratricopeptide (TPR) repeat protein